MKTDIHFRSHLAHLPLETKMLHTNVVQKLKTHILGSVTGFSSKMVPFMKYCGEILKSRTGHR